MYNGDCALKLDTHKGSAKKRMAIKGNVVKSWLKLHDDAKRNVIKMGNGDYCVGICMPG